MTSLYCIIFLIQDQRTYFLVILLQFCDQLNRGKKCLLPVLLAVREICTHNGLFIFSTNIYLQEAGLIELIWSVYLLTLLILS